MSELTPDAARCERLQNERDILRATALLVGSDLPIHIFLEKFAHLLFDSLGAAVVQLALVDGTDARIAYMFSDDQYGHGAASIARSNTLNEEVLRRGEPLVCDADGHGFPGSAMFVLSRFCGSVVGVLSVASRTVGAYDRDHASLLEMCATYIGARLYDEHNSDLAHEAVTDALTGLANRRAFDDALRGEWRRCARHQEYLALAIVDVDFFKRYNDAYGHVAGDGCLRQLAQAIAGCVNRPGDVVARYGGEEFGIVLPHTAPENAATVGEKIADAVRALVVPHEGSSLGYVTLSIGIASFVPKAEDDPQSLVSAADACLYEAKNGGRNRVVGAGYQSEAPAARPRFLVRQNLPRYLSPPVGLEAHVAEISALLRAAPIVTILGPGGVGKTRLAVETASELLDAYTDGVCFVDLAPIDDPSRVPDALAAALNLVDDGDPRSMIERVAASLRGKSLLIVLDNCEHVISAAAAAAERLSRLGPTIGVLATSREQLGVASESRYQMPILSMPPQGGMLTAARAMQYGAIALFSARAREAKRRFVLTDENAGAVADIVRRVDGLPLAIELAAAQVKTLNVREVRERVNEHTILGADERGTLQRHRTLPLLIGWSYELLDDEERALLRRLSAFRGSWTLAAADAIYADAGNSDIVRDLLVSLVSKSLVVLESFEGSERYRLLGSTREFALARLDEAGESELIARRHCRYFALLAREASDSYWSSAFDEWIAAILLDIENYRSAIAWGLIEKHDVPSGIGIVAGLRFAWYRTSRQEGTELVGRAIAAVNEETPVRTRALLALAIALLTPEAPDQEAAFVHAAQVFSEAGDRSGQAEALLRRTRFLGYSGRFAEAAGAYEEALAAARETGHVRQIYGVLNQANWLGLAGDPARARACFDEAATLMRGCDDRDSLAILQLNRGELFFGDGDIAAAIACAREAEALFRERRYEPGMSHVLNNLAAYQLALGVYAEAWKLAREALDVALRRDDPAQTYFAIGHLAEIAAANGDPRRAASILGHIDAALEHIGVVREPTEQRGYERTMESIRSKLSEAVTSKLIADGAAMAQSVCVQLAKATPSPSARH